MSKMNAVELRDALDLVVDLLRKSREGTPRDDKKEAYTFALQMIGMSTNGEFGECEPEIPEAGAR
mgnify:CR=1 FL=1